MLTRLKSLPRLSGVSITARLRVFSLLCVAAVLSGCITAETPYKGYAGDIRPASELALVKGDYFYRKDWLNSYVDAVRFLRIDGDQIENSRAYDEVFLSPGMRELQVYYSWDMGARKGLAPALVSYASSRETTSRVLHIRAEAGKVYSVKASPVFDGDPGDIGSLTHVDFWVEDSEGHIVLSKEEGRFRPSQQGLQRK